MKTSFSIRHLLIGIALIVALWLALGPLYSPLAGSSWDVAAWIAALALLLRWMKV